CFFFSSRRRHTRFDCDWSSDVCSSDLGIGYKLARTNIHSCDFSSSSYTYVTEGDKQLKSFNVEHDKRYRIPFIKQVLAATRGKLDRKSTRLNSSHSQISYAVFCLKKKT